MAPAAGASRKLPTLGCNSKSRSTRCRRSESDAHTWSRYSARDSADSRSIAAKKISSILGVGRLIGMSSIRQCEIAAHGASCAERFFRDRLELPFDPSTDGAGIACQSGMSRV